MTTGNIKVHSENILPIIKRWLYSDREIFLRELVSNACDAISKLRILRDKGELDVVDSEFRIDIKVDKENGTVSISDTGIGMTKDEVEKYIAQLAFSGAEDFVKKHQNEEDTDQIIGHFGLGFYSVYMVSDFVEIQTLSYQENAESAYWSCDGGHSYTLDTGTKDARGTSIILKINEDNSDFLESAKISEILKRYCSFLPVPVYLDDELINTKEPLWIKSPSDCTEKDYIDFYHHLYPMQGDPLFWIHLNVDFPFNLKGILYFPKIPKHFQMPKESVHLYCNRVFVIDNCKDILPEYLMMLRGVIDSPDIPLNVSRSQLQVDRTVRQVSSHISKKVSDRLCSIYKSDKETFLKNWDDINLVIKIGAIEDNKFYSRVKDILVWKSSNDTWLNANDYIELHKDKCENKIFYTTDSKSSFIELYQSKGIEVLTSGSPADAALMQTIEQDIAPAKFQRIDAELDASILDKDREKSLLDEDGKTEASKIADCFRSSFKDDSNVEVEAKSLASDELPALIILDENMRRLRDHIRMSQDDASSIPVKKTFVVNTNHPLVQSMPKLSEKDPELSKKLSQHLYQLAELSQREMEGSELHSFVAGSQKLLSDLTERALKL